MRILIFRQLFILGQFLLDGLRKRWWKVLLCRLQFHLLPASYGYGNPDR
jgi:predicted Zn-dependent protease